MSGFLPDLASWALGGGAGNDGNNNNNNNNNENDNDNAGSATAGGGDPEVLTDEEVRARRLARMEAMSLTTSSSLGDNPANAPAGGGATPMDMDVDSPTNRNNHNNNHNNNNNNSTNQRKTPPPTSPSPNASSHCQLSSNKKAKESKAEDASKTASTTNTNGKSSNATIDPVKKLQRKKEFLLKKVLHITLLNGVHADTNNYHSQTIPQDPACVAMTLDDPMPLEIHSISELLAARLSLSPEDDSLRTIPPQKPLLVYLAQAHRKASEELKMILQSQNTLSNNVKKQKENEELANLLQEIQRQVVSYAASALMEPDLFPQGKDGKEQLAHALTSAGLDPTSDITFGVSGPSSSFYFFLCEELVSQDPDAFENVLQYVVSKLMKSLQACESLDSGVGETSALGIVATLTSVCCHKKAALKLAQLESLFLIPAAGTPKASETVRPPMPTGGAADILRMFSADNRPYLRRSGPGIEKETLLGLVLRVSTPKSNPAFSPTNILRQSMDSVERATNQQRQQLQVYQEACHQLIMALIKGGPDARAQVLQWFVDFIVVNPGATAMRPDTTKVSSPSLLLNVSVALLKLCDPFVSDQKKHHLVDPSFVYASETGKIIFPTSGDQAISRLGESSSDDEEQASSMNTDYAPINSFIPQIFFMTARSMALGLVPQLSSQENLIRHISHQHYELSTQNRDVYSDPHFSMLVSRQRSNEVALFQEEMISDTVRFVNLTAKILLGLEDDVLRRMPEHFVDNMCDILMSIAKLKPRALRGMDVRFVFGLVVKLLSPTYASMVRNYNLRAMLGDVLHEIFLPAKSESRDSVPASLACDPLAAGQTYLLSDKLAQKTLAPSLLLLYGEVEHTGYYDKMSHRAKISSLLKYLWESSEHRPAFRAITQNKESFIKFANGIINETNALIATVMQKLPEIRTAQKQMENVEEWGRRSEEEQNMITSRLEESEREVRHALPLCNKTLQMFGFLNTDADIRSLFLLGELCPRLVNMLLHVLGKLVGSKGIDLKVDNPERYEFRPKEMLRDLCAIFALFASSIEFQEECAKSGCKPDMLRSAIKRCRKLNLLTGESMTAFESLPDLVEHAAHQVKDDEALFADAPDEFLDEVMSTFMKDPVRLPSGHFVDRSTITQHLLNDPIDPFNREPMTIEDVKPATALKAKIDAWVEEKRAARM